MKSRLKIPGFVIIITLIALIGLGAKGIKPGIKGIKYILTSIDQAGSSKASQGIELTGVRNPRDSSSLSDAKSGRSVADYQVVIESNLLRPLGWQRTVAPPAPVVQRPARMPTRTPEPVNDLIFTGIVNLDGQNVALIEDVPAQKAYFLKEGDKLKDYTVESVGEESVVLVNNDSKIVSVLGSRAYYNPRKQILIPNLANALISRDIVKNTDEESASVDTVNERPSNLSLIEQMRARRRKELGQE